MTILWEQQFTSGEHCEGDNGYFVLRLNVTGSTDDVAIKDYLASVLVRRYDGKTRESITVTPVDGNQRWTAEIRYTKRPDFGEHMDTFETGGNSVHITQSLETINSYGIGEETAPDNKGAIAVTDDDVQGVDIIMPEFTFTESHIFGSSQISESYKRLISEMTGTVNNFWFRGHDPGEVLFLGAYGQQSGYDSNEWRVTFKFSVSRNKTDLTIGEISGIAKGGWEYLWVRYQKQTDDESKTLVQKPMAVYIEKVYESSDFDYLEIED